MGESSLGGGWLFVIVILVVLFGLGGNGFGYGNNAAMAFATQADITSAINAQTSALNQQGLLLSSANNNYETARLIDNQSMAMLNQNNTNLVNAIQGFNQVNQNISNGFSAVNQNIANLGFKMEECCCSIKTMLLENRLQDTQIALQNSNTVNAINAQSQYLLSQLGTYTPAAPAAYSSK